MRYMLHTLLATTVAVALAAAQPQAATKHVQKKKAAAAPHSMTGCLAKGTGASTYTLNTDGKGPKTVEILSSSVDLAPHVGHKVTITGTTVGEKAAAKAEVKAEGKKGTKAEVKKEVKDEAGEHHMNVTGLKMVAPTCS